MSGRMRAHEPHQRARLGLRGRARPGVVAVERLAAAAPAPGEVAVEVDPARVLARAAREPVRVDGAHRPDLHALRRRRAAAARRITARPGGLGAVDRAGDEHGHRRVGCAAARRRRSRAPCTECPPTTRGASARRGAASVAATASAASTPVACHSMQTVIVGAGTFGASLAWTLARAGDEVVLVDQFEPGDARATSGGESRLIRCAHGARRRTTRRWRGARGRCGASSRPRPARS